MILLWCGIWSFASFKTFGVDLDPMWICFMTQAVSSSRWWFLVPDWSRLQYWACVWRHLKKSSPPSDGRWSIWINLDSVSSKHGLFCTFSGWRSDVDMVSIQCHSVHVFCSPPCKGFCVCSQLLFCIDTTRIKKSGVLSLSIRGDASWMTELNNTLMLIE
jgi:hypothetical protein